MNQVAEFVEGMACLDKAEELLMAGAGSPPTALALTDLRSRLDQARALLDTAARLLQVR